MRLGVYGGSFNPVHKGHLHMARAAFAALGLDRLEFVPVGEHPLKPGKTMLPFCARLHLLHLALACEPGVAVSAVENAMAGPSYTLQTLRLYEALRPGCERWFLLGAEDLLAFPKWREAEKLVRYANLAVFPRGRARREKVDAFVPRFWPEARREASGSWRLDGRSRLVYVDAPPVSAGATDIRRRFLAGEDVAEATGVRVGQRLEMMRPLCERVWRNGLFPMTANAPAGAQEA